MQIGGLTLSRRFRPISGRIALLLIVLGAVTLIAFYSTTEGSRLAHDPLLEGADYVGYTVCHRITDRSFSIAGRQLPLCARCTGMYLGVTLAFVVLALAGRRRWSSLPPLHVFLVLIGFVALMGIDGINSYSHFFPNLPHVYEPQNWLRLVTGMGTGLTMGVIVFPALAQALWRDQQPYPALGSLRELAGLLILAAIVVALVLSNQSTILYVLGLASAAGVILILTALNSIVLLIVLKRDARATNWQQAAVPLLIGLVMAVGQVAIVSYLRFSLTGTMTGLPGL